MIEFARKFLFAINNKHGFAPAKKFSTMLKRRKAGIICAGKYGHSSCQLEEANNKIKMLKRKVYGCRDFEYFSLKIKGALPGKRFSPRDTMKRSYAVLTSGLWDTLPFPLNR
ncbi:MAG: transposase [Burkholderiales bacterium]|nr:transposase [Burkholderiales bacterium]